MYLDLIKLIKIEPKEDKVGNIIPTLISQKETYAHMQNVSVKEFYNAVEVGMKPVIEFKLRQSNYDNESQVIYEDTVYTVIRSIKKPPYDIVLVCEVKEGRKNDESDKL